MGGRFRLVSAVDALASCAPALARPVEPTRTEGSKCMAFYGTYTFRLRHLFTRGEMRGPSLFRRLVHLRRVFADCVLMRRQPLRPIVFVFQGCSRDLGLTRNINEGTGASALVQAGAGGGLPLRSHEALHSSGADARLVCVDS